MMLCFHNTLIQSLAPCRGHGTVAFLCHPFCLASSLGSLCRCAQWERELCAWRFTALLLKLLFASCAECFAHLERRTFREEMINSNHFNYEHRHV